MLLYRAARVFATLVLALILGATGPWADTALDAGEGSGPWSPALCASGFPGVVQGAVSQCAALCAGCPDYFALVEDLAVETGCGAQMQSVIEAGRAEVVACLGGAVPPQEDCVEVDEIFLEARVTYMLGPVSVTRGEVRFELSTGCANCPDRDCRRATEPVEVAWPVAIQVVPAQLPEMDLCACQRAAAAAEVARLNGVAERLRRALQQESRRRGVLSQNICVSDGVLTHVGPPDSAVPDLINAGDIPDLLDAIFTGVAPALTGSVRPDCN